MTEDRNQGGPQLSDWTSEGGGEPGTLFGVNGGAQAPHPVVRKPGWLDRPTFDALLDRCGGAPHCEQCGSAEDLTVDHIVPRYSGGSDDLSNLQFLCRRQNSTKGIRPDAHWSQQFYWDALPSDAGFAEMRHPQRALFNEIAHYRSDWFGRNITEIARHLYLNAWVVGAGKTLGIPAAAWAINRVIQEHWGAARRIDRVLVITKDQAIRDQIADSLEHDLTGHGIVTTAPRVGIVSDGSQFRQRAWLDSHDVIITCEQQLWESNGGARADLAEILAYFPMIAFDEPHYAPDQIAKIVDTATSSICVGFTGTPVDKCGNLLPRMVALTIYDYQEASEADRSLKYLDDDPRHLGMFVREMGIHDADVIEHGIHTTTEDTQKNGYSKNIEPAKAVVRGVIEEVKARDELVLEDEMPAPHRRQPDVDVSLLYPVHALVFFDSVAMAEELAANTNKMFEDNRQEYPAAQGFRVEVVHAGATDGKGARVGAKPLARKPGKLPHPWMRTYKDGNRLSGHSARFLFAVDMAREGVNNPLCGIVGVACTSGSVIEAVQGWLGRQLRGIVQTLLGRLSVPPAPLDTVKIVTHRAFNAAGTIQRGICFISDMRGALDGLPTIDSLEDGEPGTAPHIERKMALPVKEKIAIACYLGEQEASGTAVDIEELLDRYAPSCAQAGPRRDSIREWVSTVRDEPARARREIRLDGRLEPVTIVMRERIKYEPADRDLERYIKIHEPGLADDLPVSDSNRRFFLVMHRQYSQRFHQPPLTTSHKISDLSRQLIASPVMDRLGRHLNGDRSLPWKYAYSALRRKFCVPETEKLRDGGDWDTPQAHAIIRRPEIREELVGWVIGRLIDEGHCPALRALRSPEAGQDAT